MNGSTSGAMSGISSVLKAYGGTNGGTNSQPSSRPGSRSNSRPQSRAQSPRLQSIAELNSPVAVKSQQHANGIAPDFTTPSGDDDYPLNANTNTNANTNKTSDHTTDVITDDAPSYTAEELASVTPASSLPAHERAPPAYKYKPPPLPLLPPPVIDGKTPNVADTGRNGGGSNVTTAIGNDTGTGTSSGSGTSTITGSGTMNQSTFGGNTSHLTAGGRALALIEAAAALAKAPYPTWSDPLIPKRLKPHPEFRFVVPGARKPAKIWHDEFCPQWAVPTSRQRAFLYAF
jgi:hypothetical protein